MSENKYIKIDAETIEKFSNEFLLSSKSNPFYNKNVFFTSGLRTLKYNEFQIIGNLGGWANDNEFNTKTDYFIIADRLIDDLKEGKVDEQIQQLEIIINAKGKKYKKLKIISEIALLNHIVKRCYEINDKVNLRLLNKIL